MTPDPAQAGPTEGSRTPEGAWGRYAGGVKSRRMNRVVRWGGAAACAVVVVVYTASGWWSVSSWAGRRALLSAGRGAVGAHWINEPDDHLLKSIRDIDGRHPKLRRFTEKDDGWLWRPVLQRWSVFGAPINVQAIVPLWLPLALSAAPTALAWCSHLRRRRAGLCPKCGYDPAGLPPTAPCPECGRARA
jgi:hypothetical protein